MKVFISVDIEGIGCVVRSEHSSPQGREFQWARKRMTEEVNAATAGAFAAGASEVVVADSHNVGLNLLADELDPRVRLVMGSPRPLSMMEGVQLGFDAVFLVGYHAMAGTADGVIVHTYTGRIASVKLNGTPVGEIGISAALAGHYGAPVALVTGDDKAVREARELLGDVETVEVKKGLGAYAALCLTPAACNERIRQGAERALRKAPSLEPFRVETPVELAVGFTTASAVDRVAAIPGVERVDGTTVAASAADVLQAFRIFHLMTDLVELVPFI
jgi:D-amino peptidase